VLILPLPTEDRVRLPLASIFFALLILVGFYVTWLRAGPAEHAFAAKRSELATFLWTHPDLHLDAADRDLVAQSRFPDEQAPSAEDADADAQTELAALVSETRAAREAIPYRRDALVPARGLFQRGWVTNIFVHHGWLHLLGNLFFMYLTAPFVEEALGSSLFLPFFLLGGIAANAVELFSLGQGSSVAVMGASGAIAACLGAFGVRFATERRVKVLMWVFFPIGPREVREVPAWIWVVYFGAYEAYSALVGASTGVAHLAHLGGLAFGAGFAYLWGKREPLEMFAAAEPAARTHVAKALASLRGGDPAQARAHYQNALRAEAGHPDALLGLLRLDAAEGNTAQASQILAGLLRKHLAMRDTGNAVLLSRELAPFLDFARLGPQLAYALSLGFDDVHDAALLDAALTTASTGGGLIRGKALLRTARLRHLRGDPPAALELADEVAAQFPELDREARALRAELEAAMRRPEALEI